MPPRARQPRCRRPRHAYDGQRVGAFVPQFFAGIRTEADAVEHYDRLERRTREVYRLGSWVTPKVLRLVLKETERLSRRANLVFERCDVLLTPATAAMS